MNLHIENEETCRLAGDLAELTGESVTGAVTVALRERLARERRRRDVRVRAEELLAIGERCSKLLGLGPSAAEHGDLSLRRTRLAQAILDSSAALAILFREPVFGRSNRPTGLNFGDCFACALAKRAVARAISEARADP